MISRYCASEFNPKCIGYIYSLRKPDGDIFYVGKTKSPYERYAAHVSEAKSNGTFINLKKKELIKSIVDKGDKPIMWIIEEIPIRTPFDETVYNKREFYWTSLYLQYGWDLSNIRLTDGLQYEINYKKLLLDAKTDGNLDPRDFYYGLDEKGFLIYNLKQIKELGFSFSKNQFARHWDYIINIEKYRNIHEVSLNYNCYSDIHCEENRNFIEWG